nr:MAG TPA: hypothetical protein [Caudoviricetes sp.]
MRKRWYRMRLSELTVETARRHARSEPDDTLDPLYLEQAKQYVLDYTGLTADEADQRQGLVTAALVVFAELTDNKGLSTDSDKANLVLSSFMDMHRTNLL